MIELEHVSFSYDIGETDIKQSTISDVSLHVRTGEC